jgi:hypothetical protein
LAGIVYLHGGSWDFFAKNVLTHPLFVSSPTEASRDGCRVPTLPRDRCVLRSMQCTDEVLQAEIAAALRDPLRVPEMTLVEATVTDGVVTLRGTVRYPIDLPVLTAIVWRFLGVVEVHNEATAREPNPQPPPWPRDDYDSLRFMR